jgi:hypothetical protein
MTAACVMMDTWAVSGVRVEVTRVASSFKQEIGAAVRIERNVINFVLCVNFAPPCVGLALQFGIQSRSVVQIVTENFIAIFAVFPRIQDMLMPELIYLLRRWRKNFSFLFVGQRIEKPPVVALHPRRLFPAPAQLFSHFDPHRGQLQVFNVPFRE